MDHGSFAFNIIMVILDFSFHGNIKILSFSRRNLLSGHWTVGLESQRTSPDWAGFRVAVSPSNLLDDA